MKKMVVAALFGAGLVFLSAGQASAWSKFNFTAGVTCCYEGANNCVLWGALQGGDGPYCVPAVPAVAAVPVGVVPGDGPVIEPTPGVPGVPVLPSPTPAGPKQAQPASYSQQVGQVAQSVDQAAPAYYVPSYWYNNR
jgi:hypothetical protein